MHLLNPRILHRKTKAAHDDRLPLSDLLIKAHYLFCLGENSVGIVEEFHFFPALLGALRIAK